jgi:two-component system NtrC family sensor kinase
MGPGDPIESKLPQTWRILVVEDDAGVRREATDVLEDAGYRVDQASDGLQALTRLGQSPRPNLILLDLMLPGLDGWQLRAAQLASPTLADIPVLVMSGDDSAQARAINADGYLPKPFEANDLLSAVERVLLRFECRRLQLRLHESERFVVLGTLAAELGHEINNPLTYIMNNLTELETALAEPEQEPLRVLVRQAQTGAERIHHLVGTLNQMSRKREGGRSHVDLAVVLETAIAMTAHHLTGRARLVRDFHGAPVIWANPARLGQLFINLLANAAQAIPPGRAAMATVTVRARQRGDTAEVEIVDTGAGMSPEIRDHLFEPFFTTKPPGEGTGLGLVISRNIAREHGGRLEVESSPGQGATVRVLLPLDARTSPRPARAT